VISTGKSEIKFAKTALRLVSFTNINDEFEWELMQPLTEYACNTPAMQMQGVVHP
jgi:hypothetical protein